MWNNPRPTGIPNTWKGSGMSKRVEYMYDVVVTDDHDGTRDVEYHTPDKEDAIAEAVRVAQELGFGDNADEIAHDIERYGYAVGYPFTVWVSRV